MSLKFKANPRKIIESITWIATRLPENSQYSILKTLFYADKFHLQKYGRPVTGDTYIKMTYGPVASLAYDIIKRNNNLPKKILVAADDAFDKGEGKYPPLVAKRAPDMDWFSGSDIECLEAAVEHCSNMDFDDLKETTHQEAAWVAAPMNGEMDFALFLDEDVQNREALIEYITDTAPCQAV
jgi:hypothetical protein